MSKLYIVATPIGNLQDITLRALKILKEVDLILCEDTRVTKKLIDFFNIKKPLESYHHHSKVGKVEKIKELLRQGKDLALVSDSGTPGISDPGNKLIQMLLNDRSLTVEIVPVPGPSAITALASVSGLPMDKFVFMGFPPHKKGRQKFFKEIKEARYPVIIYESPHRIIKTLKELNEFGNFEIVVGRELTKKFETIYRGEVEDLITRLADELRGEFVIAIRHKSAYAGY